MNRLKLSFSMLLASIVIHLNAQEAAPIVWDGSDETITLAPGETKTFSYTAAKEGILYLFSTSENTNPVTFNGGLWADGKYDADSPLRNTESYDNGCGFYGTINVLEADEIRFTLTAPSISDEGGSGQQSSDTRLQLQSLLFDAETWKQGFSWKGQSWETPIDLTLGKQQLIPVYDNTDTDMFEGYAELTFCRFTASSDGVISVKSKSYEILYLQEDLIGTEAFKRAIEGNTQYMHDIPVRAGNAYIIAVPNNRPDEITARVTADRIGMSCADPIEITSAQSSYGLVQGHNWFMVDISGLGAQTFMDLNVKAGWNGEISYWSNCLNEDADHFHRDTAEDKDTVFHKNLDPNYTYNNGFFYIDVYMDSPRKIENGIAFNLREPEAGESCSTAIPAETGENVFSGRTGDYWFTYVSQNDCDIRLSVANSEMIYFSRGCGQSNTMDLYGEHKYRVRANEPVYIAVSASTTSGGTLTITENELVSGDNCDMPIDIELGQEVSLPEAQDGKMRTTYFRFIPKEAGHAIIETTCPGWTANYWSLQLRPSCDAPTQEYDREQYEDEYTGALGLRYKFAVSAGVPYILHLTYDTNEGKDIVFATRFEKAAQGQTCENAIPITELDKNIPIDGEANLTAWYTYTADKSGFYTIKGCACGSRSVKVGDCAAQETRLPDDNSYENAYMRGYYKGKVYVEAGQPFFVYIRTYNEPYVDENGKEDPFFVNVSFQEARPGETFATAIKAEPGRDYTLATGADAYEAWYYHTIPAGKEQVVTLSGESPIYYTMLSFYADENTMLKSFGATPDYTDTTVKNENSQIVGRTYTFAVSDNERTVYIKTPVPTMEGVTWNIEGDGNAVEEVKTVAMPVISPNPNNGTFRIDVPGVEHGASVSIRDMAGKEVYKASLAGTATSVSLNGRLSAGLYLVTITNGTSVTVKMIVK